MESSCSSWRLGYCFGAGEHPEAVYCLIDEVGTLPWQIRGDLIKAFKVINGLTDYGSD